MFGHLFVNRLRCLIRNREKMFCTLMFPIVLAFFFKMAFGNLGSAEAFSPIRVVVVEDSAYQANEAFRTTLTSLSDGDNPLLIPRTAPLAEAEQLLKDGEVSGLILVGTPVRLEVQTSGMNQNILKSVLDSYNQYNETLTALLRENPAEAQAILAVMADRASYTTEASATSAPMDPTVIYFFSLIAMACFYGGFFGSDEVTDIQADITARAARINVAPVHKLKTFLYSSAASLLIHMLETVLLVLFLRFVLGVSFGNRIGHILLTVVSGSLAGVSFGACISALVKKSEGIKVALLIGITMLGSALAGMMFSDVKYVIATKVPLLSWINPVNLLTDALYSLYFFDSTTRFYQNLGVLAVMTVLFCAVTYQSVRRTRYASL